MANPIYFDELAKKTIITVCKKITDRWNDEESPETPVKCEIEQIDDDLLRWKTPPIPIDPLDEEVGLPFDVDFRLEVFETTREYSYVVVTLYLYALTEPTTTDSQRKDEILRRINEINKDELVVKFEYEEGEVELGVPSWVVVVREFMIKDGESISEDELRFAIDQVLGSAYAYYSVFEALEED